MLLTRTLPNELQWLHQRLLRISFHVTRIYETKIYVLHMVDQKPVLQMKELIGLLCLSTRLFLGLRTCICQLALSCVVFIYSKIKCAAHMQRRSSSSAGDM